MHTRSLLMISLLGTLLAPGCFWATTKSEGDALRKDVRSINDRLAAKERALEEQIAQLQKVLDDSAKLLKRNSADLGADVDQLRSDVRTANGLMTAVNNSVTELRNDLAKATSRIEALEQRVGQLESGRPSASASGGTTAASTSAEELWKLGSTAFEAARYNEAIDVFKRLVQSFPSHDRADDSQYFRGQSHTNLKDWDKAIAAYQGLVDKYPDSALADDGLYFAALAAQSLKNCTEARAYLSVVRQKYPKSNVTKASADLDAALKKDAKNRARCAD